MPFGPLFRSGLFRSRLFRLGFLGRRLVSGRSSRFCLLLSRGLLGPLLLLGLVLRRLLPLGCLGLRAPLRFLFLLMSGGLRLFLSGGLGRGLLGSLLLGLVLGSLLPLGGFLLGALLFGLVLGSRRLLGPLLLGGLLPLGRLGGLRTPLRFLLLLLRRLALGSFLLRALLFGLMLGSFLLGFQLLLLLRLQLALFRRSLLLFNLRVGRLLFGLLPGRLRPGLRLLNLPGINLRRGCRWGDRRLSGFGLLGFLNRSGRLCGLRSRFDLVLSAGR